MASTIGRTPDDLTVPPADPSEAVAPPSSPAAPRPGDPIPVADRLRSEPYVFEFFQAVRLLQLLDPDAALVGGTGPVEAEPVRFRALPSTSFPPSAIADLQPTTGDPTGPPSMTVTFFGLIGPKGVLPSHYTEKVMRRIRRDDDYPEQGALRAWLDLFNHRLTGLFYRAWEKYRFVVSFERGERRPRAGANRDPFTSALLSLIGLGMHGLRDRLGVAVPPDSDRGPDAARIDDLSLLAYSGLLAERNRTAVGLESILSDTFKQPSAVRQFQGQWLSLEEAQQSRLGGVGPESRNELGRNVVAGTRVWELRSKVRIRLGPLSYDDFRSFLPDPARPGPFFALTQLVRFYLGADLDFEVQLVLRGDAVPPCQVGGDDGAILGWNAWIATRQLDNDQEDAIFQEIVPDRPTGTHRPL